MQAPDLLQALQHTIGHARTSSIFWKGCASGGATAQAVKLSPHGIKLPQPQATHVARLARHALLDGGGDCHAVEGLKA